MKNLLIWCHDRKYKIIHLVNDESGLTPTNVEVCWDVQRRESHLNLQWIKPACGKQLDLGEDRAGTSVW